MHDLVLHAAKAAFRLRISDRRTSKGCMACLDSLPPNRKNEPLCCTLQNAYLYRLLDAKVGMVLAAGLIARLVDRPGRDDGVRRPLSGGDVIQCHTRHAVECQYRRCSHGTSSSDYTSTLQSAMQLQCQSDSSSRAMHHVVHRIVVVSAAV
jgi:hypothetical protein